MSHLSVTAVISNQKSFSRTTCNNQLYTVTYCHDLKCFQCLWEIKEGHLNRCLLFSKWIFSEKQRQVQQFFKIPNNKWIQYLIRAGKWAQFHNNKIIASWKDKRDEAQFRMLNFQNIIILLHKIILFNNWSLQLFYTDDIFSH